MALSLQSGVLTWQKVRQALTDANPAAAGAFKALREWLVSQNGNPDLQFIAFAGADVDDAAGKVLADAACQLYGWYGKKTATATDSYLVLLDDATDDAGGATDARVSVGFLVASEPQFGIYPNGLPMATGVVGKTYTDYDGVTDSTAGDSPNGFIIIGAA